MKPGVSLSTGFTCKSLNTHSKTNISNPIVSKVCNCTNITNNTNSPQVLELRPTPGPKTSGEFVLLVILIQFHIFEPMGLEILVLLCVFNLLHVKPGLRPTPGPKTFGEFVLLIIFVQFHTLTSPVLKILVYLPKLSAHIE